MSQRPAPVAAASQTPSGAVGESPHYVLMLFVSGTTPNSVRAISNTRQLCEQHLAGRYTLTIVDLYQQPELAREQQIVAAPTLLRRHPAPERRLVGSTVDVASVLLPGHRRVP